jgi:hypothetical protein
VQDELRLTVVTQPWLRSLGSQAFARPGRLLAGAGGVKRLGVETVPQIVTRGWLVDVAPLGPGEVIGVPDIDPLAGDAVLFHSSRGAHWNDAETYLSGEPGTRHGACELAGGARRRADWV